MEAAEDGDAESSSHADDQEIAKVGGGPALPAGGGSFRLKCEAQPGHLAREF